MKINQEQCDLLARKGYPELGKIMNFMADRIEWLKNCCAHRSDGSLLFLDHQLEAHMLMAMCDEHMMILRSLL